MTVGGPSRSRFVQTNGLWTHYLEWDGSGPTAVLAHAGSFCANIWAPLAQALSSHYHVLSVDLRGHGDTTLAPDGDYSWRAVGQDMAAFLEALDITDALAIGHSYGGAALLLGGAFAPGRLRCAVHMEPAPVLSLEERPRTSQLGDTPQFGQPRRRRIVWDSRQQIFDSYRHKPVLRTWRRDFVWAFIQGAFRDREDGQVELKKPPWIEERIHEMARPYPGLWEDLAPYNTPTLIVMGEESPEVHRDSPESRRFLEVARNTRLLWVPGTGHFMPMERPQDFEAIVCRFAREVEESVWAQR